MFDPFENRVSRDIRNQLSEQFLIALTSKEWEPVDNFSNQLKKQAPDQAHIDFIDNRMTSYHNVFNQAGKTPLENLQLARLLWDHKLYFECHEWLEEIWLEAEGNFKKAIQGLIRMAGAHVLHEAGRLEPAKSSAQKAIKLILDHKNSFPEAFDADELLKELSTLSS